MIDPHKTTWLMMLAIIITLGLITLVTEYLLIRQKRKNTNPPEAKKTKRGNRKPAKNSIT